MRALTQTTLFEIDLMMCDKSGRRGNITGDHGAVRISRTNISGSFAALIVCNLRIVGSHGTFLSASFDKFFSPKQMNIQILFTDYSGFFCSNFFEQQRHPDLYFTVNSIEFSIVIWTLPYYTINVHFKSFLTGFIFDIFDTYGFVTTPFLTEFPRSTLLN